MRRWLHRMMLGRGALRSIVLGALTHLIMLGRNPISANLNFWDDCLPRRGRRTQPGVLTPGAVRFRRIVLQRSLAFAFFANLCLKVAFASLRALRRIFCTLGKSALLIKTFPNFRRNKFHIGRFPNR
jgi:hypothetical protein